MRAFELVRPFLSASTAPLALLLGAGAFLLVVGPRVLLPTNIAWLAEGDPAADFLGWHFFRNSPWTIPVGLNPTYGLELSSAIVYSDSNPLLAIVFKPLSPILPDPFQYLGLWILGCFLLQAWFGWKLAGLINVDAPARLFATGLFVFAPPMLWRLNGHFALVGHFLVLWALYLSLRPDRHREALAWGLVLSVAVLVQVYLFAMVGLLWLASWSRRAYSKAQPARAAVGELVGVIAVVTFVCWQAGYFSVLKGASGGGFGFWRMDTISPINSSGWSYILKALPEAPGDYEGFNYLGLGVLFLWLLAIPALLKRPTLLTAPLRRRPFLASALAALAIFSLSNEIGVASVTVVKVPLASVLHDIAGILRSSGRMFWPVYYALILAAIFIIVRGYRRQAGILLAIAFLAQVIDTSAGWLPIRAKLMVEPHASWASPLKSEFWADAARRFRKLRLLLPGNALREWQTFAYYSGRHGLATNAVYFGRIGADDLVSARAKADQTLSTGDYEHDTLYILDRVSALKALDHHDTASDLLAQIDGFVVLAPGWKACSQCPPYAEGQTLGDLLPPIEPGNRIEFSSEARGAAYLQPGWSEPEDWGVWSNDAQARLVLPTRSSPTTVLLEMNAFVTAKHPRQRVEVSINGVPAGQFNLTQFENNEVKVAVPPAARDATARQGYLDIVLTLPDRIRPVDIGEGPDPRALAVGLKGLTLTEAHAPPAP